jgi:hypothetical protein
MTEMIRWSDKDCAPYTTLSGPAQAARDLSVEMKPSQKSEPDQAVKDEKDRDDEVQQPWHDQDQKARNHRNDRRDMSDGEGHLEQLLQRVTSNRGAAPYHPPFTLFHDRRRIWLQGVPHCSENSSENNAMPGIFSGERCCQR